MKTDTSNKQDDAQNASAVRDCLTRLVRIRPQQRVWQDFSGKTWPIDGADVDLVFEATCDSPKRKRWKLVRDGFGSFKEGERYRNGAIYVVERQIEFLDANKKD